jgi:hypothetical protein
MSLAIHVADTERRRGEAACYATVLAIGEHRLASRRTWYSLFPARTEHATFGVIRLDAASYTNLCNVNEHEPVTVRLLECADDGARNDVAWRIRIAGYTCIRSW